MFVIDFLLFHMIKNIINNDLIFDVEIVIKFSKRSLLISAHETIEFGDFDEVYTLVDPSIPIHMLIGVKLSTAGLHTDGWVGQEILSRKNVKVEGIGHIAGFLVGNNKGNADLYHIVLTSHC